MNDDCVNDDQYRAAIDELRRTRKSRKPALYYRLGFACGVASSLIVWLVWQLLIK